MTDKTRDFYRWTRDKQKAFEEQVKQANDTKFPKSGGTITGPIFIDIPPSQTNPEIPIKFRVQYLAGHSYQTWGLAIISIGTQAYIQHNGKNLIGLCPVLGLFPANPSEPCTLGFSNRKWANVYTQKLNNGADLELPTKAGTIALVSDIEDILKKYGLIPDNTTKE